MRPVRRTAITGACERALNRSAMLSRRYGRTPVPAAVVALALVHHPRSAAFLALQADRPDGYQALQVRVWSDLLSGRLWPAPPPNGGAVRPSSALPPSPLAPTDRRGASVSIAREEGRSELIPVVIWALVAGPLLLYAVGRHVASHRSGLIAAAIVGRLRRPTEVGVAGPARLDTRPDRRPPARHHRRLAETRVMTFADKALSGRRRYRAHAVQAAPSTTGVVPQTEAIKRSHAKIRALGERANATLKTWKILARLRCCPQRATALVAAIFVLQLAEEQRPSR